MFTIVPDYGMRTLMCITSGMYTIGQFRSFPFYIYLYFFHCSHSKVFTNLPTYKGYAMSYNPTLEPLIQIFPTFDYLYTYTKFEF